MEAGLGAKVMLIPGNGFIGFFKCMEFIDFSHPARLTNRFAYFESVMKGEHYRYNVH